MMKKRRAEFSLKVFVEVSFTFLVLFLFLGVGSDLQAAVLGGGDRNSRTNFKALTDNIQLMLGKPTAFEYQEMTIYLEKKHYIFGFTNPQTVFAYTLIDLSKEMDFYKDAIKIDTTYPKKCEDKPCLCLYKKIENKGVFAAKPIECQAFGDSVVFHSYFTDKNYRLPIEKGGLEAVEMINFPVPEQYPVIYSDYPPELQMKYYHFGTGSKDKTIQRFYIEKFVGASGKAHILITPYLTEEQINERIDLLAVCPEGSDNDCLGKKMNSFIESDKYCLYDDVEQKCSLKKDLKVCEENVKLDSTKTPCICGSTYFVDKAGKYCYKRRDNKYLALWFDCAKIKDCPGYCSSMTTTEGCDPDEVAYCKTDRCGIYPGQSFITCEPLTQGEKIVCVKKVTPN